MSRATIKMPPLARAFPVATSKPRRAGVQTVVRSGRATRVFSAADAAPRWRRPPEHRLRAGLRRRESSKRSPRSDEARNGRHRVDVDCKRSPMASPFSSTGDPLPSFFAAMAASNHIRRQSLIHYGLRRRPRDGRRAATATSRTISKSVAVGTAMHE